MRIFDLTAISLLLALSWCSNTDGQESAAKLSAKPDVLNVGGYYGGLPFYTAFHQQMTTRLILLKAAPGIPELTGYLLLTDAQSQSFKDLRLPDRSELTEAQIATLLDPNIAFDEHLLDPSFYSILSEDQRELLDRISVEFDGLSGLSRKSIADRLSISEASRTRIGESLVSYRDNGWLPYFRYEFAAKLPLDHDYRKCVFVGQFLLALNQAIAEQLNAQELEAWNDWIKSTQPPRDVVESIKRAAPLPGGLFSINISTGG